VRGSEVPEIEPNTRTDPRRVATKEDRMKQRKLRLDDLQVDTFEVSREPGGRGTVYARQETDGCTPLCSHEGETCAYNCTASMDEQRECVGTLARGCVGGTLLGC
jgi:hypothetical protein